MDISVPSVNRFCSLPTLNLLSRRILPPTFGNLVGLRGVLPHSDLVNHVPNFLGADAAAFLSRSSPQDAGGGKLYDSRDDGEIRLPLNLYAMSGHAGDISTPAWPPNSYNEPIHTADSAAVHGVGVFQRLLALMSRRASALDGMQKRYIQQSLLSKPYSVHSPGSHVAQPVEQQNITLDQSNTNLSENSTHMKCEPQES